MTPQQARGLATRQVILETAARAFAKNGLARTSLNELIRESGLTKGAFYFHFASKEELALATFRLKQEQLVAGMFATSPESRPALERLAAMLRARVRLLDDDPTLWCVLKLGEELRVESHPDSEYSGFQDLALTLIEDLLAQGRADGSVRDEVNPSRDAWITFAALIGMDSLSTLLANGSDLVQRNEDLVDFLVRALGPEGSPSEGGASRTATKAKGVPRGSKPRRR